MEASATEIEHENENEEEYEEEELLEDDDDDGSCGNDGSSFPASLKKEQQAISRSTSHHLSLQTEEKEDEDDEEITVTEGDDDLEDDWPVSSPQHQRTGIDSKATFESVYSEETIDDEDFLSSIRESMEELFRQRTLKQNNNVQRENSTSGRSVVSSDDETEIVVVEDDEDEYEEHVIEKWFGRDQEPDDLEAACRALIPIVYKGESNMDTETMLRRTPQLIEFYRHLKQHYDYKKEVKQDICSEDENPTSGTQQSLADIFRKRAPIDNKNNSGPASGSAAAMASSAQTAETSPGTTKNGSEILRSPIKKLKSPFRSPGWKARSKKRAMMGSSSSIPPANLEDSQTIYEEVSVFSEDGSSYLLLGESTQTFEEFAESDCDDDFIEIEDTIHEEVEGESENVLEETEREGDTETVEETVRDEEDDDKVVATLNVHT